VTLLFVDGFDNYASGNTQDFTTRGWDTNAPIIPGLKHGNATYGGIKIVGSKMLGYNYYPSNVVYTDDVPRSGIFGCWFKSRSGFTSTRSLIGLFATAGSYYSPGIQITAQGRLGIYIYENTNLWSDFHIQWDKWVHLEFKYQWASSTTMINELRANGVTIQTLPIGISTIVISSYYPRYLALNEDSTYHIFDHLYLMDLNGTSYNDFIGPYVYVKDIYPTGAGETTTWTPNGSGTNVANIWQSAPDEDTSVVATVTSGNLDLYRFPRFTGGLGDLSIKNIHAIASNVVMRKNGGWNLRLKDTVRSNSTNYSTLHPTGTVNLGFRTYQTIYETNPGTALAWTSGDLENVEFGFELWNTGV
jgi:hypothetical protein